MYIANQLGSTALFDELFVSPGDVLRLMDLRLIEVIIDVEEIFSDVFLYIYKTLSVRNIVDSDASLGISKVTLLHAFEPFLSGCVP